MIGLILVLIGSWSTVLLIFYYLRKSSRDEDEYLHYRRPPFEQPRRDEVGGSV